MPPNNWVRVGKYTLIEELAAGGMATVYLAVAHGSVGFRKVVAVKRCHPQFAHDPEFVAMFTDEARLTSHISHPNVAETLDVFRHDRELLLVLAYVHGVPLATLAAKQRALRTRFPLPVAISILCGVLDGLEAAHRARGDGGEPLGIVHRDVSPQNILVGLDGTPRLIDFGVAHAVQRNQVTADGQVKGKFSYMAPEQLSREGMDGRADVWALSVVAWELLAGRRLINGDIGQMVADILTLTPPDLRSIDPDIPPAVAQAIGRGLRRDRRERWGSAAEMAAALRTAIAPAPPSDVEAVVRWLGADELARRDQVVGRARNAVVLDDDTTTELRPPRAGAEPRLPPRPQEEISASSMSHGGFALPGEGVGLSSLGSSTAPTQLTRRRAVAWKPIGIVSAVAVVGLLAIALGTAGSDGLRASGGPPSASAVTPVSLPASAAPETSDVAPAQSGPGPGLPPPASTARTVPATTTPPSSGTPPKTPAHAGPKPTASLCADPARAFVVGEDGVRRLRRECR